MLFQEVVELVHDAEPTRTVVSHLRRQHDLDEIAQPNELRRGPVEIRFHDLDPVTVCPCLRPNVRARSHGEPLKKYMRVEPSLRDRIWRHDLPLLRVSLEKLDQPA